MSQSNTKIIIGITGLAHSGKDTSADYLIGKLSDHYRVIKVSLADQLKIICQKMIHLFYNVDIPLQDFYDMRKKEAIQPELPQFANKPFKIRNILQLVGTEIFRDLISKSLWCHIVKDKYLDSKQYDVVVISDVRMPDELDFFQKLPDVKFLTIRIVRPNRDLISLDNQKHSTEQHILDLPVQHEIINDGSLMDLYSQLDKIMNNVL
jgi:hypothetical protein